MLTHNFPINESFSVDVGIDYSMSMDDDKWTWEGKDDDYIHWRVTGNYSVSGWDLSLGYEDTDLNTFGDSTLLFTVGRTFSL